MFGVLFVFVVLILLVVLILGLSGSRGQKKKTRRSHRHNHNRTNAAVYGEFIRPFTFGPGEPIVQPGGSLVFPITTVNPVGVTYVEDEQRVGLLVPQGTYLVSWVVNPSEGAMINLLVNGVAPLTTSTGPAQVAYTESLTVGLLNVQYLVTAPLEQDNLISLVNAGSTLFTLSSIPNTAISSTSILTQIRVQRIGPS
jgi:hypothetical protein